VKNAHCFTADDQYDEYFHINFGKKLIKTIPQASHCGIFESGDTIRIIVYCGQESGQNAGQISKEIANILGGSGGGDAKFAQGGGKDTSKKDQAIAQAKSMILG
ncbi:MAG: DHHA1 domain-containing protein, partial [Nitrosopumilaceae archaeon]|nr:DHHA1 domain-containing protein [Nitrosopumilaceae archaeon]